MKKFDYLKIKFLFIIIIGSVLPALTLAETIVLKSGKTVEAKIIEKTNEYIKIDFYGVPLTYFLDEVESIDGIKLTKSLEKSETQSVTTSDKIYTNDNYGFSLIIPNGWFVVSGEQKRQEVKEKIDKEMSCDKLIERIQEKPGDKVCPLTQSPEAIEKILGSLKETILSMYPVVTFYKFDPDSTSKNIINPSIQIRIRNARKTDTLENMKFDYAMLKRFVPDIHFIEEAHDVVISGVSGVRAIYQDTEGRINFDVRFVKNNKKYEIRFLADSQSFKEYMPYFEKALSSFNVKTKEEIGEEN